MGFCSHLYLIWVQSYNFFCIYARKNAKIRLIRIFLLKSLCISNIFTNFAAKLKN